MSYGWESWDNGKAEFNLQPLTNFAACSDWARRSRAARLWVKRPGSLVYTHTHTHRHTHTHSLFSHFLNTSEEGGGRVSALSTCVRYSHANASNSIKHHTWYTSRAAKQPI